ncbi:hypothetical protein HY990_07050 [Candidatus Micrarchaeota archaeon]|nr:hypothetical protein [Candidatus Micrarchaeota archaeon]
MEDMKELEEEIRELIKKKMGERTYLFSLLYTKTPQESTRTDGLRELAVVFNSSLDPAKKPYYEVNAYLHGLDNVLANARKTLTPDIPRIKV